MSDTSNINDIICERDKYKQEAEDYRKELQAIINGCVHPDKATRRVILDLAPIRAVLKKYSNWFFLCPFSPPYQVSLILSIFFLEFRSLKNLQK